MEHCIEELLSRFNEIVCEGSLDGVYVVVVLGNDQRLWIELTLFERILSDLVFCGEYFNNGAFNTLLFKTMF